MKVDPLDDLGRHGRRSRVIWHPGSIPPYSSLWITIQRFLILNQPVRGAFAQDFLWPKDSDSSAKAQPSPGQSINDYQTACGQPPMRLARFARVLKEPEAAFRGCQIGDFPRMVRPYFTEFAVCPYCLADGFHSVLYAFRGIQRCPAHNAPLESLKNFSTIHMDLFTHALRNPFSGCQLLQKVLGFPTARIPKGHAQRDRVLGEIANWLMDVDSRCWLGQHRVQRAPPFDAFTKRLVHLKAVLGLPDAVPTWVDVNEAWRLDAKTTDIVRFGAAKVCLGDLVDINDRRANQHQTDLSVYQQTIWGDFKAIRRHLKHCVLGKRGRQWLGRLSKATNSAEVNVLLDAGGVQAHRAWLFLAWSRHIVKREFNQKVGLHTRPVRFAVDAQIPLWVANLRSGPPSQGANDIVHLWVARWVSAAGLLAYWRAFCLAAEELSPPIVQGQESSLLTKYPEPQWCLGISASNEPILCFDCTTTRSTY